MRTALLLLMLMIICPPVFAAVNLHKLDPVLNIRVPDDPDAGEMAEIVKRFQGTWAQRLEEVYKKILKTDQERLAIASLRQRHREQLDDLMEEFLANNDEGNRFAMWKEVDRINAEFDNNVARLLGAKRFAILLSARTEYNGPDFAKSSGTW